MCRSPTMAPAYRRICVRGCSIRTSPPSPPASARGSVREALAGMVAQRFDAVITEVRMPDIDGRALYEEIERRWPRQASRVVFVTGDTLSSTLRDYVTDSGRPVIEKPFLPSEVRRVVAELGA